ncbi:MAG: MgtC/SapB family protein [Ignavibacteriales bacterium]|nr:MgtC/SapB family protein [Ignavibacteriales bacterium]MCF8307197.1 MgtC/SapB family protein [Ignavibacteriales bacterium]MCF8315202.1 MgtC/SapB family protein [Ignavibacteriales bacterium]MCF8438477.1 MgtC/SapB family protein [Ignavibacteriales bacterium]
MEVSSHIVWPNLFITLLIGVLIGAEREKRKKPGDRDFGGIRTFPIVALLGYLSAFLASFTSPVIFVVSYFLFGLLVAISYYVTASRGEIGGTTEVSFLLIYVFGALIYWDHLMISAVSAVMLMIFLSFKTKLRGMVGKVEDEDIYATIKFAIITIIILPLLPDQTLDPFDVLNPRKIWYMVVLIAGISFIGYVLFKLIGTKRGIQLLSILGGVASSTAVTLSFSQRSKEAPALSGNLAAGIVLASTIMFPRIYLIILMLDSEFATAIFLPVIIFTAVGLLVSFFLWRTKTDEGVSELKLSNPFQLKVALKFGVLFAIILFVSKVAQNYMGDQGIYLSSLVSGFADLDAIALSLIDLRKGSLLVNTAAVSMIIAFTANTIVKASIAYFIGAPELKKSTLKGFSFLILANLLYMLIFIIFR